MIRAVIIDDELDAIEVLELMLQSFPEIQIVGHALSVNGGIETIQSQQPDLVFLDVEMPQKNGFELLNAFEQPAFKVIFITAFDQYAVRAIKYSALDYILKPINRQELEGALEKVKNQITDGDERLKQLGEIVQPPYAFDRLIITSKKGFIVLRLDQIVRIESMAGNYAFFYMENGQQFLCTKPLSYYQSLLEETTFIRIHRSYLINLQFLQSYDNEIGEVLMKDQKKLPVAVRRKARFKQAISSYFRQGTNA